MVAGFEDSRLPRSMKAYPILVGGRISEAEIHTRIGAWLRAVSIIPSGSRISILHRLP